MNIVLDTNVLLSAAFFKGKCKKLLAHCLLQPNMHIFLSLYILEEFIEHGSGKLKGPSEKIEAFVSMLRRQSKVVEPAHLPNDVFQDQDDLPILGTAVAAQADSLITGDKQLLAMGSFRNIEIVAPGTFYEKIKA